MAACAFDLEKVLTSLALASMMMMMMMDVDRRMRQTDPALCGLCRGREAAAALPSLERDRPAAAADGGIESGEPPCQCIVCCLGSTRPSARPARSRLESTCLIPTRSSARRAREPAQEPKPK
jgi:hypothetical protein